VLEIVDHAYTGRTYHCQLETRSKRLILCVDTPDKYVIGRGVFDWRWSSENVSVGKLYVSYVEKAN
jgi:hypothetical protein